MLTNLCYQADLFEHYQIVNPQKRYQYTLLCYNHTDLFIIQMINFANEASIYTL